MRKTPQRGVNGHLLLSHTSICLGPLISDLLAPFLGESKDIEELVVVIATLALVVIVEPAVFAGLDATHLRQVAHEAKDVRSALLKHLMTGLRCRCNTISSQSSH